MLCFNHGMLVADSILPTDKVREIRTWAWSFCFDCDDPVVYDDHSTNPSAAAASNELGIPKLTYAYSLIELKENVKILDGDDVELVVNNNGAIHVSQSEVLVESGAYFWAHKMDVCPILPASPITPPASMESRSWEFNKRDKVKIVPNPFTTSTNIAFSIPADESVRLTVWDVSRWILFDQELHYGAGTHTITLDQLVGQVILYYHLQTAAFPTSMKMLRMVLSII